MTPGKKGRVLPFEKPGSPTPAPDAPKAEKTPKKGKVNYSDRAAFVGMRQSADGSKEWAVFVKLEAEMTSGGFLSLLEETMRKARPAHGRHPMDMNTLQEEIAVVAHDMGLTGEVSQAEYEAIRGAVRRRRLAAVAHEAVMLYISRRDGLS